MPITMKCHACGQQLRLKDEHAGKRVKCVKCSHVQLVPGQPVPAGSTDVSPSAPSEKRQPVSQSEPTIPRIASRTGSLVAVMTLFDSDGGWSVLGTRHELPLSWLRSLLFDKLGWVGLGMFLDDSLASILYGTESPAETDASLIQGSRKIPPGAAVAIQLAAEAGFLTTPVVDCLELKRFQVSYRVYEMPSLRGILLNALSWILVIYLAFLVLLPVWGVKWLCRYFPSFQRTLAHWYGRSSIWSRAVGLPLLWIAGYFVTALCFSLFVYTLFWPPLFLRLLAKTGDYVLLTTEGLIFYSAFHQMAAQVPRNWPLLKNSSGKYSIILGDERNWTGRVCSVCDARLPEEWAEGQDLNVEPLSRFGGRKLLAKADHLREQYRGQNSQRS